MTTALATRSALAACLLGAALAGWPGAGAAEPAPSVKSLVPDAKPVGAGRLTWFGFHAYDAVLYAQNARFSETAPFALELTYARKFKGSAIAERSISEIRKLGLGVEQELVRWQEVLGSLFPDVVPGDRLTGVSTAAGQARFFHNDRPIGAITEERLKRAFFAIWLDPRTSAPELRARLLGEAARQ